jgi:hypothetical protein
MSQQIVNGIRRSVPQIKRSTDVQFAFKSRRQLPFFLVWKVFYDEKAEVEFAYVIFNSIDLIGF